MPSRRASSLGLGMPWFPHALLPNWAASNMRAPRGSVQFVTSRSTSRVILPRGMAASARRLAVSSQPPRSSRSRSPARSRSRSPARRLVRAPARRRLF